MFNKFIKFSNYLGYTLAPYQFTLAKNIFNCNSGVNILDYEIERGKGYTTLLYL